MRVRKIVRHMEPYRQCSWPKENLHETGWKGYREERSQYNRKNPDTCMRHASWEIDGKSYCTQHAGLLVLEEFKEPEQQ